MTQRRAIVLIVALLAGMALAALVMVPGRFGITLPEVSVRVAD